jgi:hypothetical protein
VDKKMEDEILSLNEKEFNSLEECKRSIEFNGELGSLVCHFNLSLNIECQETDTGSFMTFLEAPSLDEGYSELRCFMFNAKNQEAINKVFNSQCSKSCFMNVVCVEKPAHNTIFDIVNAINVI